MAKARKGVLTSLRSLYWLTREPGERREPFPLRHKLTAWRHGFLSFSEALYGFPDNDRREYVNDFTRLFRCGRINPLPEFLDHKLMLRAILVRKGIPQPETIAVVFADDVLLDPLAESTSYIRAAALEPYLIERGGSFILKPQNGRFGRGVFLLEVRDGALVRRRGTETTPFRLGGGRREVLLIERRVQQGAFWRNLYPESSNTIRALTMWAPGDLEPFLGAAAQRIGTAETMPTDNFSGGGIAARIDLATGMLGAGSRHPVKARGNQLRGIMRHPVTGAEIEGAVVPHWDRLREVVLRAASSLPTNRYIGWDVIVDEGGTPIVLEGNARPGLDVNQVERGLLSDPKVRRFYEQCGVL